jgi:hypothetical protein
MDTLPKQPDAADDQDTGSTDNDSQIGVRGPDIDGPGSNPKKTSEDDSVRGPDIDGPGSNPK